MDSIREVVTNAWVSILILLTSVLILVANIWMNCRNWYCSKCGVEFSTKLWVNDKCPRCGKGFNHHDDFV
jgi:rubrerythrin